MKRYSTAKFDPETLELLRGYNVSAGFYIENWIEFQKKGCYEKLKTMFGECDYDALWADREPYFLSIEFFVRKNEWDNFRNSQLFQDIAEYSNNEEVIDIC